VVAARTYAEVEAERQLDEDVDTAGQYPRFCA
jgi:hypothetical protein